MANKKTRSQLSNIFQDGAMPDENDFSDLFESFINRADDTPGDAFPISMISAAGETNGQVPIVNDGKLRYGALPFSSISGQATKDQVKEVYGSSIVSNISASIIPSVSGSSIINGSLTTAKFTLGTIDGEILSNNSVKSDKIDFITGSKITGEAPNILNISSSGIPNFFFQDNTPTNTGYLKPVSRLILKDASWATTGKTKNYSWSGTTFVQETLNWEDIKGNVSENTSVSAEFIKYEKITNKGAASGYAPLDSTTKVPRQYIPSLETVFSTGGSATTYNTPYIFGTNNEDTLLINDNNDIHILLPYDPSTVNPAVHTNFTPNLSTSNILSAYTNLENKLVKRFKIKFKENLSGTQKLFVYTSSGSLPNKLVHSMPNLGNNVGGYILQSVSGSESPFYFELSAKGTTNNITWSLVDSIGGIISEGRTSADGWGNSVDLNSSGVFSRYSLNETQYNFSTSGVSADAYTLHYHSKQPSVTTSIDSTLDKSYIGKTLIVTGSVSQQITLPLSSTCSIGDTIRFIDTLGVGKRFARTGSDIIYNENVTATTFSFTPVNNKPGLIYEAIYIASNQWRVDCLNSAELSSGQLQLMKKFARI